MVESKKMIINEELASDPNFVAFISAAVEGKFRDLPEGTFVAFYNGEQVGQGADRDSLIKELHQKGIEGIFIQPVNEPIKIIRIPSPRIVRN